MSEEKYWFDSILTPEEPVPEPDPETGSVSPSPEEAEPEVAESAPESDFAPVESFGQEPNPLGWEMTEPEPMAKDESPAVFSEPEIEPLIPGTEIIGRRARRAALEEETHVAQSSGRRGRAMVADVPANKKPCAVSPFVEFAEIIVGALVAAILVLTLICRTGVVEGSSMVPTMHQGDRYIISDLFYTPEQGDIVVFRPEIEGEDELWIKRVIALEGQTVYIDPNTYQVYVDGQLLDEPYLDGAGTIPHTTENPITVPEGCVYVLGDNRAISHDSRYEDLGCVEIGQLAGRVILRFWPIEDFGFCE